MSSAPREAMVPLTRWQYFTKTLYHNAAAKTRFVYNKVVYEKDEALQKIEEGNGRINMGLLLVLLLRLPKDITAHLTDTGLRER
mgnify:CR=1 FL=1